LTNDEQNFVRRIAVESLSSVFSEVPDKQKAWSNLQRLTNDEDYYVRSSAAEALGSAFSYVPDKQKAWNDLHTLTNDQDRDVRSSAAQALGSAFSQVPDKQQAWNNLHRLINDEDQEVRSSAAEALGFAFSQVPDKQEAWNDLVRLTGDESSYVRARAAEALGSVFSQVPDKQEAWSVLHRLTKDEYVSDSVVFALGYAFSHIPDKREAWNDLHRMIKGEYLSHKVSFLYYAIFHMLDKQREYSLSDYYKMSIDDFFRSKAAFALGYAFSQIPDKRKAWNDLHRLTTDENEDVRRSAAWALGYAFSQIPDKRKVWNDLHRMTNDEKQIRCYANYSLGKISIFKASLAEKEEDYKIELEKAIEFFEKASQESPDKFSNPSRFCLPFYRSFHTIIFKDQEAKEEMDKYLEVAKKAIEGSKSKEILFEAVENLANALKEVQNLENVDLEAKKSELNFYRQYCYRAAELMRYTEETAPFATITIKKGLPILDRNLKELLEEIQRKAKIACKESKGTAVEDIACGISKEVQKWEISNPEEMARLIEKIIFALKTKIPNIPENKFIYDRIESLKNEKDVTKQYNTLDTIIPLIPQVITNNTQNINIKVNSETIEAKDLLIKKIISSAIASLGVASALSEPICRTYDLQNQYSKVFAVIFLIICPLVFVIIEGGSKRLKRWKELIFRIDLDK